MMTLQEKVEQFDKKITILETKAAGAKEECDRTRQELEEINIELLKKSSIILGKLSEKQRSAACIKLEELCTFALQYAISSEYTAKIRLTTLRGKPAAQLFIINTNTGVETIPMSGSGGGMVDIISTALRFVIAEVWRDPCIDGPIILDEAYKHLSKEHTGLIAEFLKNTAADFGRQIILSTHNEFIASSGDQKIHVSLDDKGHSQIRYNVVS